MNNQIERRMISSTLQFRAAGAGLNSPGILEGYAAKFGVFSGDLGGFLEVIKPGAFTRALKLKQDVRALMNHDPNFVLGRSVSGTLSLVEDSVGLKFKVILPNTSVGRDAYTLVSRKDISGCSFAFKVANGGENWTTLNGGAIRELLDVDLFDISAVVYPAYSDTNVSANALAGLMDQSSLKVSPRALAEARARGGAAPKPTVPGVLVDELDRDWIRRENARKFGDIIRRDFDETDPDSDPNDADFNGQRLQKELCKRCGRSGVKEVAAGQFYCALCGSADPYMKKGK